MSILIPSKNIYNKDNDKVKDNKINEIDVYAIECVPNNKNKVVFNSKTIYSPTYKQDPYESDVKYDFSVSARDASTDDYGLLVSAIKQNKIYSEGVYSFARLLNNEYATKLYTEKDEEKNEHEIKYNVYCDKIVQEIESTAVYALQSYMSGGTELATNSYGSKVPYVLFDEANIINTTVTNNVLFPHNTDKNFTKKPSYPVSGNFNPNQGGKETLKAEATINDETDKTEYSVVITENDCTITFNVLSGVEIMQLGGFVQSTFYSNNNEEERNFTIKGQIIKYIPTRIEFSVYGDTVGIELQDKIVNISLGQDNIFTIEGNELMQTQNTIPNEHPDKFNLTEASSYSEIAPDKYYIGRSEAGGYYTSVHIGGDKNSWATYVVYKNDGDDETEEEKIAIIPPYQTTHEVLYNPTSKGKHIKIIEVYNKSSIYTYNIHTLANYYNGKETATILCDISDYYEYDATANNFKGKKVIAIDNSTKKMAFDIYDKVIPMVYGANGQDKPLSKYKNGNPKTFEVLATKIIYDGAVWQELTLQEV